MMPMPRAVKTVMNTFMNILVTFTAAMALSPICPAKKVSTVPRKICPSCSSITGNASADRLERYGKYTVRAVSKRFIKPSCPHGRSVV